MMERYQKAAEELYTRYRRNDPVTSKNAAASIYKDLGELQTQILKMIEDAGGNGMTDEELSRQFGSYGSTARTRRAELAAKGLLFTQGTTRKLESGRQGRIWFHHKFSIFKNEEDDQLCLI